MTSPFAQFDEMQLLALIEDDLDENRRRALLAKLEAHPEAMEAIRRMRADRAALREVEDPALPRDFVSELEPMLARPMLFAPATGRPGELRRRHRRAHRRRQWPRAAAAAVLLMAIGGLVWATAGPLMRSARQLAGRFTSDEAVSSPAIAPGPAADSTAQASPRVPLEQGMIHHFRPEAVPVDGYAFATPGDAAVEDRPERTMPGRSIEARLSSTLALVVEADSADVAEAAIRSLVPKLESSASVVRNTSSKAGNREVEDRPSTPSTPPRQAGGSERRDMEVDGPLGPTGARVTAGYVRMTVGQVEGVREFTPTRDEQTRFADLGATHTICVKRSRLNDLLGQARGLPGLRTQLRLLAAPNAEAPRAGELTAAQRLDQLKQIRAALMTMQRGGAGDPIVMLPVVVRGRR